MESKWSSEKPRGGGADFPLQAWGTTEWQSFLIQEMYVEFSYDAQERGREGGKREKLRLIGLCPELCICKTKIMYSQIHSKSHSPPLTHQKTEKSI